MDEPKRLYRMTEQRRQTYLLLLLSGKERQGTMFREACDDYWAAHPEEWEQVKTVEGELPLL